MLANAIAAAEGRDAAVAWHYGDPLGEQRRMETGHGSVDLSNRGVLRLTGPDRLDYLNALTTQLLLGMQPGDSALTLNLNPQGFVLHELHVIADSDSLWITCEGESTQELVDYFTKMRFRAQVEVEDRSSEFGVVWQPDETLHETYPTWLSPFSWPVRELLVPRTEVDAVIAQDPAGTWAYEAYRVASRVPRQGAETDHHTLPHEVGWINTAVHLNKGCYRGQETVSKVERMGQPPRLLHVLLLEGQEQLPAHGEQVLVEGKSVGFVGTAVQHHLLGPIASAVLKRGVSPDARCEVAGQSASILLHEGQEL